MISDQNLLEYYRLKQIIRYNTRITLTKESVAEHSFYVALFSLKICDELNVDDSTKLECLIKSLLHDMPEIEINDITHDAKKKLKLTEYLKQFEDDYYQKNFSEYRDLMSSSDSLSSKIVLLADILSVRQFCLIEKKLGNLSEEITEILDNSNERQKKVMEELL